MRPGRCKGCGRPIIWIETAGRKAMPCDPEEAVYWEQKDGPEMIVLRNGTVARGSLDGAPGAETGIGYISHFATCPNAGQFRGGGKHA